jgi:hypothetical protein
VEPVGGAPGGDVGLGGRFESSGGVALPEIQQRPGDAALQEDVALPRAVAFDGLDAISEEE